MAQQPGRLVAVRRGDGGGDISEPRIVTSWLRERIGRRLAEVTEARHWHQGERDPDAASLIHAWPRFEGLPPTELHCNGDSLELSTADPYDGYDMDECGDVRVAPATPPDLLAGVVGRRLTDAAVILGPFGGQDCAGVLLRLDGVDIVIGAFCDEWVLTTGRPPARVAPYWRVQPWLGPR
ncbi:hypothetical protein ACQEVZ_08360 [Dactylosporangium sp. CA-152071]|uniref:hypothetical protein n=1 Tax=Dactylosporangium sp. CA-152071 TaxID=3239933 RepID=UPI003D8E378A